jgi:hypothetical protein
LDRWHDFSLNERIFAGYSGLVTLTADERGLTRIKTQSESSYRANAGIECEGNVLFLAWF